MKLQAAALVALVAAVSLLDSCSNTSTASADTVAEPVHVPSVGVVPVARRPMLRQLTVSSELVPFQETDVWAKESGYVTDLRVDYGSRVKKGDVMAVLEIPELEAQLKQDKAAISNAQEAVNRAQRVVDQMEAQRKPVHENADRLVGVAKTNPGLVAQQEIDNAQGQDLALASQIEAGRAAVQAAKSNLDEANAHLERDQALYSYSKITAPFTGVVTQRYANLGALMQAGTASPSATPLVRLSEDDDFRLVIPVAESYVKYIRIGDPVGVGIPSLDRTFTGTVKRVSYDVTAETRTMHTEVELLNPDHVLMPGLYAEATITLDRKNDALVVPLQAVSQNNGQVTVFVVTPNNTVEERTISAGMQTPNEMEVLKGVAEGDRVVVSDRSGLKDGMQVKPQPVDIDQYKASQQ
ncbi:MAG TPA: efflux RND transporter periplasmic adaptor subunit [Bryobacteraceae bacterium]|nr:efflux RND transporter periplasmic adaptor subunit [Bryobacteraceae bacterium]